MSRSRPFCVCGCGVRGKERHHVVYAQHCRAAGASTGDLRNIVAVATACHAAHHNRSRPLELRVLPDSVFEFAAEVLGPGKAFNYLERRYAGADPRLDALLQDVAA